MVRLGRGCGWHCVTAAGGSQLAWTFYNSRLEAVEAGARRACGLPCDRGATLAAFLHSRTHVPTLCAYSPTLIPRCAPAALPHPARVPPWLWPHTRMAAAASCSRGCESHLDRALRARACTYTRMQVQTLARAQAQNLTTTHASGGRRFSDMSPWVHVTGALFLDARGPPSPALAAFVAAPGAAPPVCVTFGSMLGAEGLARWAVDAVLRSSPRARVLLLASAGSSGGQPDSWGGRVFTAPEAPHEWLFPRCAGVIFHGGAGTLSRAMWAGVPVVVIPVMRWSDQPGACLPAGARPVSLRARSGLLGQCVCARAMLWFHIFGYLFARVWIAAVLCTCA